jgi:DNA polymerase III delta prime subunit
MNATLKIHKEIHEKLDYFIQIKKIPHIIFHGSHGSGKRTLVNNFIYKIYNNDDELIKNNVMYVNCAHGKGIRFVREDLKFFAKTNINFNNGNFFKSIILANADKLTIDAQSALRRCIELFSHTTRFFIIVEDKYKLLKPILSRFCEIHIPEPIISNKSTNLYKYNLDKTFNLSKEMGQRTTYLTKALNIKIENIADIFKLTTKLYDKAYNALDIVNYIEKTFDENHEKYKLLMIFQKIKKEWRNEKLLILFLLNNIYFRLDDNLENISFM